VRCEAIEKGGRDLLIAIDRSKGREITLYSIVASSVRAREELMRYVDTFKHVKLLNRFVKDHPTSLKHLE